MGKHVRPRSHRSRWTSVIAGAAVMGLLLAGVGWVAVNALSDADDTTGSDRRATGTSSGAATTTDAERALAACRAHVAAQERMADAAAATARSWAAHTAAQLKLQAGELTVAQAEAEWERTKQRGPAEVRRFTEAAEGVGDGAAATACRSAESLTAPTASAETGKACAARDRALAAVGSTGKVISSQWAEHLEMMADMPHTDAADYRDRWVAMVAQAQEPLQRYAAAAEALLRAPTCGD